MDSLDAFLGRSRILGKITCLVGGCGEGKSEEVTKSIMEKFNLMCVDDETVLEFEKWLDEEIVRLGCDKWTPKFRDEW